MRQVVKADLVIRAADRWGAEALVRATRVEDPGFGSVVVSTPEDLLLAKLEFAEGDLEGMQGRDCVRLLEIIGERLWPGLASGTLEQLVAAVREGGEDGSTLARPVHARDIVGARMEHLMRELGYDVTVDHGPGTVR